MPWKKKVLLGLAAAGLSLAALTPASPAKAAPPGTTVFPNYASGFCLDSNYHDPAASNPHQGAVYADPCNGGNYQNWYLLSVSGGIQLKDAQTDNCLDSNSSGYVYTLPCDNGDTYQKWHITSGNFASTLFIIDAQTGRYLGEWGGLYPPAPPLRVFTYTYDYYAYALMWTLPAAAQ